MKYIETCNGTYPLQSSKHGRWKTGDHFEWQKEHFVFLGKDSRGMLIVDQIIPGGINDRTQFYASDGWTQIVKLPLEVENERLHEQLSEARRACFLAFAQCGASRPSVKHKKVREAYDALYAVVLAARAEQKPIRSKGGAK